MSRFTRKKAKEGPHIIGDLYVGGGPSTLGALQARRNWSMPQHSMPIWDDFAPDVTAVDYDDAGFSGMTMRRNWSEPSYVAQSPWTSFGPPENEPAITYLKPMPQESYSGMVRKMGPQMVSNPQSYGSTTNLFDPSKYSTIEKVLIGGAFLGMLSMVGILEWPFKK